MKDATWLKLMRIGRKTGCHQRPDRSFYIKNWQFPVCARCTGVLGGQLAGLISFFFYRPSWWLIGLGAGIMLADWLVQKFKWRESTNPRRLITGIIGGYALISLYWYLLFYLDQFIKALIPT